MKEADYIWMDGELVDWENAKVHVLTHALHYGTGIFEGIRAYESNETPSIFRLDAHMERFMDSAKIMKLDLDHTKKELEKAIEKVILENDLKECYIRPLAYRGYKDMGVSPLENPVKVMIAAWPWGTYLGEEALKEGVEVQVSSWNRHHPNVMPTKAKGTGNYLNSVMGKMEAIENGFVESIMLTPEGYVSEGTGENLFIVRDEEIYTTPTASVLEGITRDSIIQIIKDQGYKINVEKITRDQLYRASEAFFVGTAAEVTPIAQIDRRKISDGRGPITKEIQETFMDTVKGKIPKYEKWLHQVK